MKEKKFKVFKNIFSIPANLEGYKVYDEIVDGRCRW